MSAVVSRGPARAMLLAALGLPACSSPHAAEAPSGPDARSSARVAVGPARGGGATETKLGRVCAAAAESSRAEVRCSDLEVEVHRDSLTPCGQPSECEAPEVCASTPVHSTQLACRRVPQSRGACESSHDCPAGESCLAGPEGAMRCVADACGMGCPEGQACALTVERYTRSGDWPGALVQDAPSDGPLGIGCFPNGATSYARPYVNRSPCDRQGSDACALEGGRWVCQRMVSMRPCGRPIVVDGGAVVARRGAAQDWARGSGDGSEEIDPELADRFRRIAFDEHASIAAFARSLAMLSALGAPAALIAATSRALSDEVEHAREAFALAAHFGGDELGPGAFPEAVAPFATVEHLAEALLVDVIVGGCVGESLAVLEAEAWLATSPAEARSFFERVVVDEARHAELAFDTARWLIARSPSLATAAVRAIDEAILRFELDGDTLARSLRWAASPSIARATSSASAGDRAAASLSASP